MKPRPGFRAQVSFAGFAALAIGLVDAALVASSALGAAGAFQYVPARIWAVAPLCWLLVAMAVALPFLLAFRRFGAEACVIALLTLFVAIRFYGQPVRLTAIAVLLLLGSAVGIMPIARMWWRCRPGPGIWAFIAVTLVLLAATLADRPGRVAPPRVTPASADPDVVVVFLDTVPFDSVFDRSLRVDPQMPFLGRVAERGIVFSRAYSPSPWTLPAHFSAVTGIAAHRLGLGFDRQQYDQTYLTLAERFRRRGYRTIAVVSNSFLNEGSGFSRGFDSFEHAGAALDVCRTAPGSLLEKWSPRFAASVCNWSAGEVTARAAGYVTADGPPLFLLLNYMDAHDPFYVEKDCAQSPGGNRLYRDVDVAEYRQRYFPSHLAAIRCIDRRLGELAAHFERRGRRPLFAIVGDHGEQFGEHGLVRHGNSLYRQLLHVPFIISGPGITASEEGGVVSIDELPAMLAAAVEGREISRRGSAAVASLIPPASLEGEESWSIIEGPRHLIRKGDTTELFDLEADRAEKRNLAADAALADELARLTARLEEAKRQRVDARSSGFRSLGYIR